MQHLSRLALGSCEDRSTGNRRSDNSKHEVASAHTEPGAGGPAEARASSPGRPPLRATGEGGRGERGLARGPMPGKPERKGNRGGGPEVPVGRAVSGGGG